MKKLLTLLFLTSLAVIAGLPPTSTKGVGDSSFLTTFQFDFANIPLTHSGSKATLGTIPISQGGTGATSRNFVDLVSNESIGGTKTFTNTISGSINGNASTVTTNANLTGEVTSVGNAATLTNSAVIGKVLTGYVSGAGTVAATDTILQAIQKLNGNNATNANLTGPITSVGNATSVASQTGAGSTFVMSASPTITTPTFSGTATGSISGNAATVTTNANLTGPITSVGNATSIASQTGTGTKFVVDTSPTLVTPTLGVATGTSLNLGAGLVGSPSLFLSTDTTTGLYRAGANTIDVSVGSTKRFTFASTGTVATAPMYGANGTVSGPTFSFSAGTNSGLYRDNATSAVRMTVNSADVMTWYPGGSVGIGTTAPNANAILDLTSTTTAFMPPRMTTTQKNAIASPTAGMEVYDSTLGLKSIYNGSTWLTFTASADSDWVPCTFSTLAWTGVGTVTNNLKCRRSGPNLIMKGKWTAGTVAASTFAMPLPNNYGAITIDSSVNSNQVIGIEFREQSSASSMHSLLASGGGTTLAASNNLVAAATNPATPVNGSAVYSTSDVLVIAGELSIPISGWSVNSGALTGLVQVPGGGSFDHFSFAYGGASISTACSSSPCTLYNKIGNTPTGMTWASLGNMTMSFSKTYLILNCSVSVSGTTSTAGGSLKNLPLSCTSCNSLNIATGDFNSAQNTFGLVMCDGSY